MRRDNTRESGCDGKKRFASYSLAMQIHKRSKARRNTPGRHVYHCEFCQGWHLGRLVGKRMRRKPVIVLEDFADA
jgi:hypothetical protein